MCHTRPNCYTRPSCYKWLATQQSNSMIASVNQNQFSYSFAPFGDLLKALIFPSNLNSFNSSPSPSIEGFTQRKGSSKGSKWLCHFFTLLFLFLFALLLCFALLLWVSLVLCFALFNIFFFVFSFVYLFSI